MGLCMATWEPVGNKTTHVFVIYRYIIKLNVFIIHCPKFTIS